MVRIYSAFGRPFWEKGNKKQIRMGFPYVHQFSPRIRFEVTLVTPLSNPFEVRKGIRRSCELQWFFALCPSAREALGSWEGGEKEKINFEDSAASGRGAREGGKAKRKKKGKAKIEADAAFRE